jgi:tRNA nucleotidyltransferase (CCA-adding enzyme)
MGNKHEKLTEFEEHLLNDEKPSIYFRQLADSRLFSDTYPFTLLGDLWKVEQPPEHHPEGNVWEHTLLVVDLAAERRYLSEDPRVFMWSALLHDLGKAHTTKVRRGKITAYDHDKHGAILAADFLKEFTDDEEFIKRVSQMVRWHMQVLFVVKKLPFADIDKMVTEVSLGEIALLSLCDRLGRGDMNEKTKQEEIENIKYFLQKCQQHQDEKGA